MSARVNCCATSLRWSVGTGGIRPGCWRTLGRSIGGSCISRTRTLLCLRFVRSGFGCRRRLLRSGFGQAARPVAFPAFLGMIGRGDLHLSGVHQLAKHLTEENHEAVLRRAKGRSMREIDGLIAEIAPKPDVVSMIRALPGPRGEEAGGMIQPRTAVLGGATRGDGELWGSGMRESAAGPSVKSGAVPLNDAVVALNREAAALKGAATAVNREAVPLKGAALSFKGRALGEASKSRSSGSLDCNAGVRARKGRNLATPLSPGRCKLQVTIGQEARDTLAELQNLLSHQIPDGDPAAVVERALNVLLAETKKKRAALANKPRTRRKEGGGRTRAIPAQVRREVFRRDEGRCAVVDRRGRRCESAWQLEFHHCVPYGRDGPHSTGNIELRCRAHNQFEAELEYGRGFMATRRGRGGRPGTGPA